MKEVVKYALEHYESSASTRDLQRQVSASVRAWAEGERIDSEKVELGLGLATELVAQFGVTDEEPAHLDYNPEKAKWAVVARASAKDRYWGTEDHHKVAVSAIGVTYTALFAQLRGGETVLLPAVRVLRADIGMFADQIEAGFNQMNDQFAEVKGDLGTAKSGPPRPVTGFEARGPALAVAGLPDGRIAIGGRHHRQQVRPGPLGGHPGDRVPVSSLTNVTRSRTASSTTTRRGGPRTADTPDTVTIVPGTICAGPGRHPRAGPGPRSARSIAPWFRWSRPADGARVTQFVAQHGSGQAQPGQ